MLRPRPTPAAFLLYKSILLVKRLPLILRGKGAADIQFSCNTCGSDCLWNSDAIIGLVPPGIAPITPETALAVTGSGRLIKRRRTQVPLWAQCWDASGIRWAFATAKHAHRPRAGFVICENECACSSAVPLVRGRILSKPSCGHHRRLASRFEVFCPHDGVALIGLLRSAWKRLETLHRDGLCHGDPAHYNILVDALDRPLWIDNDRMVVSKSGAAIDYAVYMAHAVGPLLSHTEAAAFQDWVIDRIPLRLRRESIRLLGLTLAQTAGWHHRERAELQSLRTKHAATALFARELSYHWQQLPADHESPAAYVTALRRDVERQDQEINRLHAIAQASHNNELFEQLRAAHSGLEAVAEERAQLIARLDASAKEAIERAAVAEDAREHLRFEAASAAAMAADAASRSDALALQLRSLEAVAEERAQLIASLDAAARAAQQRGAAVEEENRHLCERVQALEAAAADLAGRAVAATDRICDLEQVAAERLAAIERLDNIARSAEHRAQAIDEVARARADNLALWHARASAAEQQLAEVTANAIELKARAEAAERECAARLVVIEELKRARDAFSAALAARSWRSRLKRLLLPGRV